MTQENEVACQLLKLEQQLRAYQKLHTGELAELWQTLDKCKQAIAQLELRKEEKQSTRIFTPPSLTDEP